MKALTSKKNINEYTFSDDVAVAYIKALQLLHAGGDMDESLSSLLRKAGLYSGDKLRVFNYKKPKAKKVIIDSGGTYIQQDFVKGLIAGESKIHKILGLYFTLTKPMMPTIEIANSFIGRHIKDASALTPWMTDDKTKALLKNAMFDTFDHSKEMGYNMTLGTVYKRLTSESYDNTTK